MTKIESLRGVIIHPNSNSSQAFVQALQAKIEMKEAERSRSLREAVQLFTESDFEICIISASFPAEELDAFFRDLKSLKKHQHTIFVQVRDVLEEGFNRLSLRSSGFDTVVSSGFSDADKEALSEQLKRLVEHQVIRKKSINVEEALNLLMIEIDRASKNRRRGRKDKFTRQSISGFMATQLDGTYEEVLDAYYRALEAYANKGVPYEEKKAVLPENLTKGNMPGIVNGEYTGTSLRVWEMLQQKFGVKVGESDSGPEGGQKSERIRRAEERVREKLEQLGGEQSSVAEDEAL